MIKTNKLAITFLNPYQLPSTRENIYYKDYDLNSGIKMVTEAAPPEILRYISINQKAKDWEGEGFKVKANIGGWDRPSVIEGLIPDLSGTSGSNTRIGLVSFEEELESNMIKWKKIIESAQDKKNTSVRVYKIGTSGECLLHKIIT